jgi:bis(5'-nucleosyl)-tetraphosphatase (symmetrical)
MANYVIGDVQGCLDSLMALLQAVNFNPKEDTVWFAGDLVNRGPKSIDTLRFIRNLGTSARTVLGNHDIHLLALACGLGRHHKGDTLADLLEAPDFPELVHWLRQQPLALALPTPSPCLLVHAGILPQWSAEDALALSAEVHAVLAGPDWQTFMPHLYGNEPSCWSEHLSGHDRLRLIINVMTRMRMLDVDGSINLKFKGEPANAPANLKPWFEFPREDEKPLNILFGHWSTLPHLQNPVGYCLDTGCVWGGKLTALRLEDWGVMQVEAVEVQTTPDE